MELLLNSVVLHSLQTDLSAKMQELGLTEFQNLSKEKQSLVMYQMLEENRRMLRLILAAEILSGSSAFSNQSFGQSKALLKHKTYEQSWPESEEGKSDLVHLNVGGKAHEVY